MVDTRPTKSNTTTTGPSHGFVVAATAWDSGYQRYLAASHGCKHVPDGGGHGSIWTDFCL
ncbi:unnamed protein product [Prunus armeniaca]